MILTPDSLIRLSELNTTDYNVHDHMFYNPANSTAYGHNGEKIGTVRDALVETDSGHIRYLLVDVGGWFSSKEVLVPVSYARIEENNVYFDHLTKDQVTVMNEYRASPTPLVTDERVLYGVNDTSPKMSDGPKPIPEYLQLLEERLAVNKNSFKADSVQVGTRIATHTETVNVPLQYEEVVIERHTVTDNQPASGAVIAASQTLSVDLEAERANICKQTFVCEEVGLGKRTMTDHPQVAEAVGKELIQDAKKI